MASADIKYEKPKARLPRYDEPYQMVVEASNDIDETVQSMRARGERVKNALRASGALLGILAVATGANALSNGGVKGFFDRTANAINPPAVPSPENATPIYIGDNIAFKTPDGKVHKTQVRMLSDISQAAQEVNPDLNTASYDAMLESENKGSRIVFNGDRFTVDKSLGIKDLGTSG